MNGELVSIIIPAYNAAATIAETIASAQRQSYPNIEIIVVDDGSTDATPQLVEEIAREDSRIRLIRQANAGVAAARNCGLAEARGTLIAPLDADDLWHPDKITAQVARLDAEGEGAGMAYCWSTDIDEQGLIIMHRRDVDRFEGNVGAALIAANFIGNGSVPLIRRQLVEEVGGWDPGLRAARAQGCEDWQLYLHIASRSKIVLADGFYVGYRQRAGAMSRSIREMSRSYDLVMKEARTLFPRLPRRLFRWSRAALHIYTAEILAADRQWASALVRFIRGIFTDPTWLLRPSTRRAVRHHLVRLRYSILNLNRPSVPRPRPGPPIGLRFEELDPALDHTTSEGVHVAQRRDILSSMEHGV